MAVADRPTPTPAPGPPARPTRWAALRAPGAPAAAALAAVLGVLCAVAGFAHGGVPIPQASWTEALAALVGVGALMLAATAPGRATLRGERLVAARTAWLALGLLVALAAWALISLAWSSTPDRSWDVANRELAYALTFAGGLAAGLAVPAARRWVAVAVVAAATAVAGWALLGAVAPSAFGESVRDGRLGGDLPTFLDLALLCGLLAPVALRLATDDATSPVAAAAALAAAVILLVALGLTFSRAGILVLVAGLAVSVAAGGNRGRLLGASLLALLAAAIPLAVAFAAGGPPGGDAAGRRNLAIALAAALVLVVLAALFALGRVRDRLDTRAGGLAVLAVAVVALAAGAAVVASSHGGLGRLDDPTATPRSGSSERLRATDNGGRRVLWDEALGAASDKPAGGYGAGSWPVVHGLYRPDARPARDARSSALQTLAERGAVGAALLGLALLALAFAVSRGPFAAGALGALAGLVTAGLVASAWEAPALVLPVLALAGATARRPVPPYAEDPLLPDDDPERGRPRWALLTGGAVLLALAATSFLLPAWSHHRAQAAWRVVADPRATPADLQGAAGDARLSSKLDPPAVGPQFVAAAVAQRRGRLLEARGELLQAVGEQPDNAEAWARLAQLAQVLADRNGALAAARRALSLDPHDPALRALAQSAEAGLAPAAASPTATGTPLPSFVVR